MTAAMLMRRAQTIRRLEGLDRALLSEALKSEKSRDIKMATRQLQ